MTHSLPIDTKNEAEVLKIIKSCIGTKIISKWSDLACKIALQAVSTVLLEENGRCEIDIKRYAKVEKVGCPHTPCDTTSCQHTLCDALLSL